MASIVGNSVHIRGFAYVYLNLRQPAFLLTGLLILIGVKSRSHKVGTTLPTCL